MRMKRVLILTVMLCLIVAISSAQDGDKFYFYNDVPSLKKKIDPLRISANFFGEEIALKTYLIKDMYTVVEAPTDYNPVERTIVNKPTIFYSMKKLNSYYKKAVKKGELDMHEATNRMNGYLDICLSVYMQDTNAFENELRKFKKQEDINLIFSRVVLE